MTKKEKEILVKNSMQKKLTKKLVKLLVLGLIIIAKSLFWLAKLTGFGSGTSLPGLLVEKFCPFIITKISGDLKQIILISGTNGKTTTRALLVHIWEKQGFEVCTNRGGANIMRGIAATLLLNQKIWGGIKSSIAILEVEEATMPILTKYLVPNQLILTNIFRDQLDAYGEIDQTLSYFSQSITQIQKNQNSLQNQQQNWQSDRDLSKNSINKKTKNQNLIPNWQITEENNKESEENKKQIEEQVEEPIEQNALENQNFHAKNQFQIKHKIDRKVSNWQEKLQNNFTKIKIGKSWQKLINKPDKSAKNSGEKFSKQGFKGLFGRQFPSQNIYESDFENNKEFNLHSADSINQKVQVSFDNNFDEQMKIQTSLDQTAQNQFAKEIKPGIVANSNLDYYNSLNEKIEIHTQSPQTSQNSIPQFDKISSLKIGKNQNSLQNNPTNHSQNYEQKPTFKNFQTQIIVNIDDSKLLTCLEDCNLPIIAFGVATDFVNKPTFEKNENKFIPSFKEQFVAQSVGFRGQISRFIIPIEQTELSVESNLPGFFNLYNTVAAVASSYHTFGSKIAPSIASFQPVFGRGEIIKLGNNQISLYLVKNPAGFEQVLDLIVTKNKENNQISLYQKNQTKSPISKNNKFNLGFLINDKIADGKDLSWLWDVDFEKFEQNINSNQIITGGTRGADLLLRLEQAGFAVEMDNYQKNMNEFLDKIEGSSEDWIICATYTVMMEFRTKISKKTKLKKIGESGF